jgi:hypothetical protein
MRTRIPSAALCLGTAIVASGKSKIGRLKLVAGRFDPRDPDTFSPIGVMVET